MAYRTIHPKFLETFLFATTSIPDAIQEALWNYLGYGLPPGSFLTAVLVNDFMSAAMRADHSWNGKSFRDLASWLSHYAPVESYGNKEKIEKWMAKSDEERLQIMIDLGLRPGEFEILRGEWVS